MTLSCVRKVRLLKVWLLFAAGLLLVGVCSHAQEVTLIKSESDEREYRYLRLPNQLQVLLISDPDADKAAAALDVAVGSNQNPPGREGLAHFLEHMLFLGTKKYPDASDYQAFIGQHGGRHNAYTAAENTNYFFDVDVDQLEPTLDRFAQFFVAPLFDEDYVGRERNAVHSEYTAGINNEARRRFDVYRELFNPAHPASRFTVGTLDTLADREDNPVRADLLDFYRDYYSSELMALVVLGRESLDELEKMVVPRFRGVPRREVELPDTYPPLFAKKALPAEVHIEPKQELRTLSLLFPVPDDRAFYAEKPLHYIGHMLGHEGKGSLLSLLKDLGWAEGLSAGKGFSSRHDALFQVSIQLTEKGVLAKDQIVALVFHMIERLESRGLKEWRYQELRQLADIDFRFQEKSPPMRTVSALAERMQRYAPADILRGDYLYGGYNEKLIKDYLSYLRSDNVLITLVAPDVATTARSFYYQTPYALNAISAKQPDIKNSVRKRLAFPEPNDFIPQRITVKAAPLLPTPDGEGSSPQLHQPQLIVDNERMRAWFRQDQEFRVPRAHVNLRLKLPRVAGSVEGAAQAQLFAALVMDELNEFAYPASLAGLDFSVRANMRGLDIGISGYSSRQGLLITRIAETVRTGRFNQERFNNIKRDLIRRWRNEDQNSPYMVLAWQIPVLHFEPYWSKEQLIAALEPITLHQFHQFSSRLLQDGELEGLFYGNLFRQEAVRLAAFVEQRMLGNKTGRESAPARVYKLAADKGKPWLYQQALEHPDQVALLYVQGLANGLEDAAHMQLLLQILQPAFFNQLRTEQQLGYIVTVFPMPLRDFPGNVFVVQSPATGEAQLMQAIDEFLTDHEESLAENFGQVQRALVRQLREPAQSMSEQAGYYWDSILLADSFDRRERLAAAVAAVTPESLASYYKAVMLVENRRLWLTSDKLEPGERFHRIEDVSAYRKPLDALIYP